MSDNENVSIEITEPKKKNKVDKLDVASIFAGDKDFNALAAYLEISENRLIRQMEIKKERFK